MHRKEWIRDPRHIYYGFHQLQESNGAFHCELNMELFRPWPWKCKNYAESNPKHSYILLNTDCFSVTGHIILLHDFRLNCWLQASLQGSYAGKNSKVMLLNDISPIASLESLTSRSCSVCDSLKEEDEREVETPPWLGRGANVQERLLKKVYWIY